MRMLTLVAVIFYIFSLALPAWCQEPKTTPIEIEADRMETSQEDSAVYFSGNVQASQGNLIIHADEMTVLYSKTGPGQGGTGEPGKELTQNIEQIKATGNVKIVQKEWVATGETMDFNAEQRIIILAGNATAWQNKNMVSGEKIILYLDEGKSVVEKSTTGGERVKAFIYPSSQEQKDSNGP
jgi:lipopolysaccharide export system protein LptA